MAGNWNFDSLYDEHTSYLHAFVRRLLYSKNATDAEDVVQEAWLRAFRNRETFDRRSSFRTWLFGIAYRCVQERTRQSARIQRETTSDARLPTPPVGSPTDKLTVEEVLAGLNPTHRAHLLLSDVYGYSHLEIEQHFGVREATSRSRLFRARKSFRRRLANARGAEQSFEEANE